MEVILKEDVINLGYKGDIVKVKDGYGRNYLIPTKKAVIASESAKKVLAEDQKQQAHKLEAIKNTAVALGEKIEAAGSLTIGTKTSSTGKIFGGVGPIQIAEALEKVGVTVDRRLIAVKTQVKEIGSYAASAKLHKEVTVEIPFEVVSE
ncbi:MAG: 50S ribosomal protein L9 [Paludibacteraceae bacterium]